MPHGPYASPNNLYATDHREIEIVVSWFASLHCAHIRRAGSWVIPCIHFVQTCKFAPYPYNFKTLKTPRLHLPTFQTAFWFDDLQPGASYQSETCTDATEVKRLTISAALCHGFTRRRSWSGQTQQHGRQSCEPNARKAT